MQKQPRNNSPESGFSLIELMIAMAVTMVVMSLAANLIAGSLRTRTREHQKSDALADAQRALYDMTREVANSGFGLSDNGLVDADSSSSAIRFRANLNALEGQSSSNAVTDSNEDVKYTLVQNGTDSYIARLDVNTGATTTILANRVDALSIRYFADQVAYTPGNCDISTTATEVTQKSAARFVVISLCVQLPAQGTSGTTGFQPASRVQLVSDVSLRNADLINY
jgi:type II secretory pathway pseudopilin PulG